uniref:NR LBD domain-containing protein n=1 Tax=Meloidogyne javanica TaxID=6303 RepID=A0A915NCG5_MELJA
MPKLISSNEFYELIAQFSGEIGQSSRGTKMILVKKLLCIGIFKSLPIFTKLDVNDQIIILKYVSRAVLLLCCCFVSYELGSHTLIEKDGFYPMAPFSEEFSFKEDKTLFALANKAFSKPMEPFHRIGISKEEFSLILAIIYLNPDIPGLSEFARDNLSIEFSFYSKMLLNYLHNKLGIDAGTKKYAECFHLISTSFIGAQNFTSLYLYQESLYKRPPQSLKIPNSLKAIFSI